MPPFGSKPLHDTPLNARIKRNPLIFGIPFLVLIVGASYAMIPFTQARYDLDSQRKRSVSASTWFVIVCSMLSCLVDKRGRARFEEG